MKKVPDMSPAASLLLVNLKQRFKKFTDPHDADHSPLYLTATYLDPRYKMLLNPIQVTSARKEILKQVCANIILLCYAEHVCIHVHILCQCEHFQWNASSY